MTNKCNCGNCKYFNKKALEQTGECYRMPPSVNVLPNQLGQPMTLGVYPPTKATNWCGEHKPDIITDQIEN